MKRKAPPRDQLTDKQRDGLVRLLSMKFRDNREALEQGKPLPFPELGLPPVEGMDVPTVPPSPSMPPSSADKAEGAGHWVEYPYKSMPPGQMDCVEYGDCLLTN